MKRGCKSFNGMSVDEGACLALGLLVKWIYAGLTPSSGVKIQNYDDAIRYATDPVRHGVYDTGHPWARLHDICDANMLVFPGDDYSQVGDEDIHPILSENERYKDAWMVWANAVEERAAELMRRHAQIDFLTGPPKPRHTPAWWQSQWAACHRQVNQ